MKQEALLRIKNLSVQLPFKDQWVHAVEGIHFEIQPGEIFALVGESGCGKSMTASAINRLLPPAGEIMEGSEIWLNDKPIHQLSEFQMRHIRAKKIGMIFQDPMASLNPVLSIGAQLFESILQEDSHFQAKQLKQRAIDLLEQVRIPDAERMLSNYPHQLSGGMKQRVVIAIALAKKPDLLIADEPTTALDVTTQAQVLHLLQSLNQTHHMAILLITHDLGVVAQMADTVAVMYAGHIIEKVNAKEFFVKTLHPYSQKLLQALPESANANQPLAVIPGIVPTITTSFSLCRFKGRCVNQFKACEESMPKWTKISDNRWVRCHWYDDDILQSYPKNLRLRAIDTKVTVRQIEETYPDTIDEPPVFSVSDFKVHYPIKKGILKRTVGYVRAVDGIELSIQEGETVALVGESGCGKTSAGKAMLRLIPSTGSMQLAGIDLLKLKGRKLRHRRNDFQMIFQDPYTSMNPKMRIHEILLEGMSALKVGSDKAEREDRMNILLEQVGLSPDVKWRYPFEFSGGQRQRLAIARALSVGPRLIVCDEPTSALDVSVQAQILNLLGALQQELFISYLFITHNINVVRYIADKIAVMYLGRIVELGTKAQILNNPKHPYTQALLESVPQVGQVHKAFQPPKGEVPSISSPPKGCHFAPRCPFKMPECDTRYPDAYVIANHQQVSCYLYKDNLVEVAQKKVSG
tara:strand:- start:23099 stop:25174 length:2076 start_codon:yes stop_codon:yes gene_type:complete